MTAYIHTLQGRIQDFKLGGAHLKKLRRTEGGAKNVGVFRVKKHDFTPLGCVNIVQSNLSMRSPLLSSDLYLKITFLVLS